MKDLDDLGGVRRPIELDECLGVVEQHIGVAELYGWRGALVLGIEIARVVDLHVLEQRVARHVLMVGSPEQGRHLIGGLIGAQALTRRADGLRQARVAQRGLEFGAEGLLRLEPLSTDEGTPVTSQVVIDERSREAYPTAALVKVAIDIIPHLIAVVALVPEDLGVGGEVGRLEELTVVLRGLTGAVDLPHAAGDDGLGRIHGLRQVALDLLLSHLRVGEGIPLGLVVALPGGLEERYLTLECACHVAVHAHTGSTLLLAQQPDGAVEIREDAVGELEAAMARQL